MRFVHFCNLFTSNTKIVIGKKIIILSIVLTNRKSILKLQLFFILERGNGDWMWSDGSAVQYTKWNLGSPSQNLEHNCVMMKYDKENLLGFWENYDCQQVCVFICHKFGKPRVELNFK